MCVYIRVVVVVVSGVNKEKKWHKRGKWEIANKGIGLMVCWRGEKNKGKEKKEKAKKKIHVWLQGRATDRMQDAQVGCCVFTELPVWSSRYRRMRQYIAFVHIHSTYLLCPPSSFLCSGAIVTACPGFTKQVRNPIGLEELFKLATECISQVTISKNISKVNLIITLVHTQVNQSLHELKNPNDEDPMQ